MKKTKRVISFILTCLMTVSAFAFTASAAKDPVYALRANAGISGFVGEAVTGSLGHDTANDIVYYHFVPKESNDWMHFAWHDAAGKFKWSTPMTMGIVMRTNKAGAVPSVRFCDRSDDPKLTITKKASPVKGDGTWEVVWLPTVTADDVITATSNGGVFDGLTHIQGFAVGEAVIGKDNLTSGTYFDIAGYAFFADTLDNVSSIDLKKTLGLGDTGKLEFALTDNGKPTSTGAPSATVNPAVSDAADLAIPFTKVQKGICDGKDTGKVTAVTDSTLGATVKFEVNPAASAQDYLTIDGYGLPELGIDLSKYKYVHAEMKFTSSKLADITPVLRFLSTKDGNIEGLPYLDAKNALKADGTWQTVTFDIGNGLAGKFNAAVPAILNHVQFSVGGRKYKAESFGAGDAIYISKLVFSNKASFTSDATGSGSDTSVSAGPVFNAEDKVLDYTKMQRGICDHKDTGAVEVVKEGDNEVVKFTVSNTPANDDFLTIDGYGAESFGIDIAKYKYMTIDMKFTSGVHDEIYPVMRFLSSTDGNIKGAPYVTSADALPADGQWHKIVINMYEGLANSGVYGTDSVVMKHLQFSVGGRDFKASNFGNGDAIYVDNITLTNESPFKDREFKAIFKNSYVNAKGEDVAPIVGKPGTKFALPEIPYTAAGFEAIGWMVGSDNQNVVQPGTVFTFGESDMQFEVIWKQIVEAKDMIVIDYAPYFNGICDNVDTGKAEIISLDGKPVVEFIPNPATTSTRGKAINLDGWSYGSAKINLELYKTVMIEYLYLSDNPVEGHAKFNIMGRGGINGPVYTVSRDPIIEGRWAIASFDMTPAEAKFNLVNEPNIMQAHIYPLGDNSVEKMSENDRIYVGKIIAIPEKSTGAAYHESFINGYADGTFGIAGNMTRAEACTIVARLVAGGDAKVPADKTTAFTDVPSDQWYHKYISYVESLGYLKSYSGTFAPNQNITRAEFVELVYNMGLLTDAGKNGTFTDVAADHPRAAVIAAAGKAGLVNGYANGDGTFSFKPDATITRAEVVKVINNAYGKKPTADGIYDSAKTKFSDVTPDHWAFADIIDASVTHISCITEDGKEVWKYVNDGAITADGFAADLEAGKKAMDEYSALIDKRTEEIKNTPNMDLSGITGKKYYVSSSTGDDNNDGLTEATAFKTVTKAMNLAVKGDAVLLKRGDMWRERFSTKAGTILTAYGTGAKPIINANIHGDVADESLWTLVEGTTDLWKYTREVPDVGNIVVNGNKTIEKFTAGVKYRDNATYVGNVIFDPVTHLKDDNYFMSLFTEVNGNVANMDKSTLYVRCSAGNPGKVYDTIELCYRGHGIKNNANTTIDNIALFYAGSHGISSNGTNVKFTNMEIGYIGGSAQNTNNGTMTRFGNGIEVYGACDNFVIDNCYVYQCYDAGITHQQQLGGGGNCVEQNVYFTNNVIDRCIYNIEYFMGIADTPNTVRLMKNINYIGNLLSRSGYGWGYAPSRAASIKGWDHHNNHAEDFLIKDNVFLLDRVNAVDAGYGNIAWMPAFEGNTYIQKLGNTLTKLGASGATQYMMDSTAEKSLTEIIGEKNPKLYYVPADTVVEIIK